MEFLIMMVAMFAIFYFLIIRPQRKRMMQHQEMQSQLTAGSRVLLSSGMFGTVLHVGERQLIVELAPGTEVTVLKGNVVRPVTPEEEEFEFDDEAPADALDTEAVISDEDLEQMYGSDAPADNLSDPYAPEADTDRTEDPK